MTNSYVLNSINEFTYSLKINGEYSMYLYDTLNKIIHTSYIDYETDTLFFSAETVLSLKNYLFKQKNNQLTYYQCIKLIDDLSKQLFYLNNLDYGFYGFDITDILTIDDTFIFCSTQHLLPLDNNNIIFTYPINRPYFSNPELFKLTSLPSQINYKCCYYSLGLLVVFLYLKTYLLVANELQTTEQIDNILHPLYNTKMYWFLKRCLDDDINNRQLLLV